MYLQFQRALVERVQQLLAGLYGLADTHVLVEQPPRVELGDYALPVAFELARTLRKAPRKIAEEMVAALGASLPDGFASVEIAGAGYINAKLDRSLAIAAAARGGEDDAPASAGGDRVIIEHTSINPNKAAHIGHLRNAILGDTFVRLLKADGAEISVQNYIDNTGVQVADVVVALQQLEGRNLEGVRALLADLRDAGERIDFYLWDLYARVSQWYDADPEQAAARKQLRRDALHALETGGNETADIAEMVATAVLHRHLETMERLGIEYDFLPRESDILQLHFWDAAFEEMKRKGVLYLEQQGKNAGCWVMRRAGTEGAAADGAPDEEAKVIVRSNGTVTYVGKDIAYHLWKFGLLPGKDFGYRLFHEYGDGRAAWISAREGEPTHPHFGDAASIYNVIDARQADPQNNVREAIRGMGYTPQAENYHHFSYAMVALTPRCAAELGYTLSEEDSQRPFVEVSGRKGFGVKADDLIDKLIAAARSEVASRHPELSHAEQCEISEAIAIGALRYYMLRYTRNSMIAFDFADALSFEGETGPYAQYAAVRAANIFRKAGTTEAESIRALQAGDVTDVPDDIWELWLLSAKLALVREQCVKSEEPAYLAKYIFETAQRFNNFYHRHHILTEEDEARKRLLLATASAARGAIVAGLGLLGVSVPAVM